MLRYVGRGRQRARCEWRDRSGIPYFLTNNSYRLLENHLRNSDSTQVVRLDVALLERGLTDSRSKAQRLIADGKVSVNGVAVTKASAKVDW